MKKFAEQLKRRSDKIKMTLEEKSQLRERVLTFMEYHPVPGHQAVDLSRLSAEQIKRVPVWNGWLTARLVSGVAVLMLIVVPTLAEEALPGDVLYPIKVRFNEELKGALSSSPYAKVEWETERLERRLAEAQVLADAGRLTPQVEADVASAILEHSAAAKTNIEAIRATDSDEAVLAEIAFSSALEVSAEVLTKKQANDSSTEILSEAVNEARANVSYTDASLSYAKLAARLEGETTRAHEYLNTLRASITTSEKDDIDRRLTDIKVKIDTAAKMRETDEVGAAKELAAALSNTRKLISFMTNLEVRRSVTVEDLVPITPTEAEEKEVLEVKLADAVVIVNKVEEAMSAIEVSSNDYQAISDTVEQFRVLEAEAGSLLAEDRVEEAGITIGFLLEISQALKDTMAGLNLGIDQE